MSDHYKTQLVFCVLITPYLAIDGPLSQLVHETLVRKNKTKIFKFILGQCFFLLVSCVRLDQRKDEEQPNHFVVITLYQ